MSDWYIMVEEKKDDQLNIAMSGKDEIFLSEASLTESELRYRRLFESAQDGILILDAETGAITDVNPYLIKLLGFTRQEFINKKLWEVGAFKDVKASKDAFHSLQKNEYIRYKDLPLRAKHGRLIQVEFVSNVYLEGNKRVIQCNIRDITNRKQYLDRLIESEASLREQSVRDYLTGLFNRRYLEETLARELLRASRKQLPMGIIMLDLDDFKRVNDTWGHAAGDKVLKELGKMLLKNIRGEDIACRYGGDEFIIVLPDASPFVTYERAKQICDHSKQIQFLVEGHAMDTITFSLGVAAFPENGVTSAVLLRSVDSAIYRAKREGRGLIVLAS
ncbi:sensor domain-containing diguanylate cyclase [bacterium]|nr:sensor domain-containing diguanylate cyclase [bacterium]